MESPRPYLVAVLEETAQTLGLSQGQHRLELVFDDGRLRSWYTHCERRLPVELAVFDEVVGDLLERATARVAT